MFEELTINTRSRTEMVDITVEIQDVVRESGIQDGICYLFIPHTTAAVTINENADPSVRRDILMEINRVIPFEDNYSHLEGNAAAHIKASLFGSSETILVKGGRLVLGTWQGIYFCEFDGARRRKVYVKVVEERERCDMIPESSRGRTCTDKAPSHRTKGALHAEGGERDGSGRPDARAGV